MAKNGHRSRWDDLLASVEEDDGLPTRDSGRWAKDKLRFWNIYIDITTRAMVDSPHWKSVVYVDLFSGPGICQIRGTDERVPGSPLIAAKAPKAFSKILLCELNESRASACETRLSKILSDDKYKVFRGDCNEQVSEMVKYIPARSLTLAFLDPTGLHLDFATVETLSQCGRVDLLILFPDGVDVMRNWKRYFDELESNLDRVLGPDSDWREKRANATSTEPADMRKLYVSIYQEQLKRRLGYDYSDAITIRGKSGPLYKLVYASKHERGLDFWVKSCKKELSGQQDLFG